MQASDRQFTFDTGSQGSEYVDRSNKAVFVAERFTFAFAGRVDIDGRRADEWLQLTLSGLFRRGMPAEEAFPEVAQLLTGKLASLPVEDANRALTMAGVGWTDASFSGRRPMFVRISNIHDDTGSRCEEPLGSFSVSER